MVETFHCFNTCPAGPVASANFNFLGTLLHCHFYTTTIISFGIIDGFDLFTCRAYFIVSSAWTCPSCEFHLSGSLHCILGMDLPIL